MDKTNPGSRLQTPAQIDAISSVQTQNKPVLISGFVNTFKLYLQARSKLHKWPRAKRDSRIPERSSAELSPQNQSWVVFCKKHSYGASRAFLLYIGISFAVMPTMLSIPFALVMLNN